MKEQLKSNTLQTGKLNGVKWFAKGLCSSLYFSVYHKLHIFFSEENLSSLSACSFIVHVTKESNCFPVLVNTQWLFDNIEKCQIWIMVVVIGFSAFVERRSWKCQQRSSTSTLAIFCISQFTFIHKISLKLFLWQHFGSWSIFFFPVNVRLKNSFCQWV